MPQDRKIYYLLGIFYLIFNFILGYVFFFNEKRDFSNYATKSAELLKVNMSHLIEDKFCNFEHDTSCKEKFTNFLIEKAKITNLLNISVFLPTGEHIYSSNEKIVKLNNENGSLFAHHNVIQSQWMNSYTSIMGAFKKVFVSTVAVKTPSHNYILIIDFNMTDEYVTAWHDIQLYCWVVVLFSLFFFALLWQLISKNNKRMSHYIGIIQKEKEHALAVSKIKADFLETMSHEIRTPMNGFTGVLELLKDGLKNKKDKELVNLALHSANHLKMILNDILDFRKLEANKIDIEMTSFNLYQNLDKFIKVNVCSVEKSEKKLKIFLDYKLEKNLFLISDQLRLNQILQNLFSNAIKFTSTGTISLHVSNLVENDQEYLILTLKDTGIGIENHKIDSLFEKFTQADASTSRLYGGTGLGLAITKKLVALLQGKIFVESKVGLGSAFTVILPLAKEPAHYRKIGADDLGVEINTKNSLKILVVEDNRVNQIVLSSLLEKDGHSVMCVDSGFKALEVLKKESFNVIFMDIQMPGLDGVETTKRIRNTKWKKNKKLPFIIACTADAFIDKTGAIFDGFIEKPIDMQVIRVLLNAKFQANFVDS